MKRVLFLTSSYHKGLKKEFQAACLKATARDTHRIPWVSVILITKINPEKYLQAKITLIWIQKPDFCTPEPGIFNLNPMSGDRF
jgi:hypothetical protein